MFDLYLVMNTRRIWLGRQRTVLEAERIAERMFWAGMHVSIHGGV